MIIYEDNIGVPQEAVDPALHKVLYLNPCCVPRLLSIPKFHLFTASPPEFKDAGETTYAGVYTIHRPNPERVRFELYNPETRTLTDAADACIAGLS